VGEDATTVVGIPQPGSTVVVSGVTYKCDRVRVVEVPLSTSAIVQSEFSSDGRFRFGDSQPDPTAPGYREWSLSYKRVSQPLPFFRGTPTQNVRQDGTTQTVTIWEQDPSVHPIALEYMILNTTVRVTGLTDEGIRATIRACKDQHGHMHIFGAFPGSYWVMQPVLIRAVGEGQLELTYSWESDPGNSGMGNPDVTKYVAAPVRPAFYSYAVSYDAAGKPIIGVVDLFPITFAGGGANPYYTPTGHVGLPGSPI